MAVAYGQANQSELAAPCIVETQITRSNKPVNSHVQNLLPIVLAFVSSCLSKNQ